MSIATPAILTEDQVDDLLYLARTGETTDLQATLDVLVIPLATTPSIIVNEAIDSFSGNGLLHMASANGHAETLKSLIALSGSTTTINLDLQNSAGNTPLHWATLNGHLEIVKVLVNAGADVTISNNASHDAMYEAEANEKKDITEWLLKSQRSVESGVVGVKEERDRAAESGIGDQKEEMKNPKRTDVGDKDQEA